MELFRQALTIMTLGMALVFLFLFIVIQCMNFTAYLIRQYEAKHPAAPESGDDAAARARLVAAIAAATEFTPSKN